MKEIFVKAGKGYNVVFDKITSIQKHLKSLEKKGKICVVCDTNVAKLYLNQFKNSLDEYQVFTYVTEVGEKSKSFEVLQKICEFLAENKFCRSDTLIALGGGVVGDLTGFVASIFLRGIDFVQVPTTFLGAIDSSVGGKTAINLKQGKNLIGSFYQPILVLCDVKTFDTLPSMEWQNGWGEALKYAFIRNAKILQMTDLNEVVYECVNIKKTIVEADEKDLGIRQILNFGHTIGHAVEICSNFLIPHGKAVAIGMSATLRATAPNLLPLLEENLKKHDIDVRCDFCPNELFEVATKDKKIANQKINYILVKQIGEAQICPINFEELKNIIKEGFAR